MQAVHIVSSASDGSKIHVAGAEWRNWNNGNNQGFDNPAVSEVSIV
jgi:hypothetical protein